MTRYLIVLAAAAIAAGSLITVNAHTTEEAPKMITKTEDGKPILLARMVVTATPLPDDK